MLYYWVTLILVFFHNTSTLQHCNESLRKLNCTCNYDDKKLEVLCRNENMQTFPKYHKNISKITSKLDISDNNIKKISSEDLKDFTELIHLDLQGNKISSLTRGFLKYCSILRRLNLTKNRISNTTLNTRPFIESKSLMELDLSFNKLSGILSYDNFQGLENLKVLILEANDIRGFDKKTFESMPKLNHLRLTENRQLKVLGTYIQPLKNLHSLELQFCSLKKIQPLAFNQSKELGTLDLSKNKLEDVPVKDLMYLSNLTLLKLNKNKFTEIPSKAFAFLGKLLELHLSFLSNLEKINDYAFDGLHSINSLKISNNPKLSYISDKAFREMATPKVLSLYSNNLTTIGETALNWYDIIVKDLSTNPWNCNCSLRYFVHLFRNDNHANTPKIVCQTPKKFKNKLIGNLNDSQVCDKNHSSITTKSNSKIWIIAPICGIVSVVILVIGVGIFIWKKRDESKGYRKPQQGKEFDDFSDKSRSHYSITEDDDGFAWDDTNTVGSWAARTAETKSTGYLINA